MDKFGQKYSNIYEKQNSSLRSNSKSDIMNDLSRSDIKTPGNKENLLQKLPSPYSYTISDKKMIISEMPEQQDFQVERHRIEDLEINLQNKGICDLQIQQICDLLCVLKSQNIFKISINLSHNELLGDRGIFKIIQNLRFFTKIYHLSIDIDYCNITDYTIDQLLQRIERYPLLRNLQLYMKRTQISEICVTGLKQILGQGKIKFAVFTDYEDEKFKVLEQYGERQQQEIICGVWAAEFTFSFVFFDQ